jgi:hypothetical protein
MKLNKPLARALLIIDGHPTRLQLDLWKDLNTFNVDVLIIPSHTSNYLQPLDLCANGYFKACLEKSKSFRKNEIKEKINEFLQEITNCAHKALSPDSIIKGFRLAYLCNEQHDIGLLEENMNKFIQTIEKKSSEDVCSY